MIEQSVFQMSELLARARGDRRAKWVDLPNSSGVYLVVSASDSDPEFNESRLEAVHAEPSSTIVLRERWQYMNRKRRSQILYVGKGKSLRSRVRSLVRFGVGRDKNHHGGEWLWQISFTYNSTLYCISCRPGEELGMENWFLEQFERTHHALPLANRKRPQGDTRIQPGTLPGPLSYLSNYPE